MKKLLLVLLFFGAFSYQSKALRDWGLGAAAIFNVQPVNLGLDGRALFLFDDVVGIAVKWNHYPGVFQLKENYYGAHFQYNFFPYTKWGVYLLAGGYYNTWDGLHKRRDASVQKAFPVEFGIGMQRNNGCVRPFGEVRYDMKWKEISARVGFLFMKGSCFPKKYCKPSKGQPLFGKHKPQIDFKFYETV